MYRVAILVNENETLHSVYADTICILKKALEKVYPNKVDDIYSFELIDKFSIYTLFEKGKNNLFTFDSLFIATNACNNKEIYEELILHSEIIYRYINDGCGNYHGIFIANQQKLGTSWEHSQNIGFLPPNFSYKLIKRKEKKSSDGKVTIENKNDWLVNFPLMVDDAIIESCCSGENNQFMPHKYRYIVVPDNMSTYEVIYKDASYNDEQYPNGRYLLLKSRISNERVVVSSMILDWAEHLEQLANIVVFITEGVNQFAFVNKTYIVNKRFSRYIKKARDYKMALKEYNERELDDVLQGVNQSYIPEIKGRNDSLNKIQIYPHMVFVFSNDWSESEVNTLWEKYVTSLAKDIIFYRLVNDNTVKKDELVLVSSFSKSIKNSRMFLCAEEWLSANYITSKWRKSIWTYEYILNLYDYLSFAITGFISPLYEEINSHYKINDSDYISKDKNGYLDFSRLKNPKQFENIYFQSYDNVFNSTCSCCNVIARLYSLCKKNEIQYLIINNHNVDVSILVDDRNKLGNWIVYKLNNIDYSKRISWQDCLMAFVTLYESGYINDLQKDNENLYKLLMEELNNCNSFLDKLFTTLDRVTYEVNSDIALADLCKILKYIYVVNEIIPRHINCDVLISAIERRLVNVQNYDGSWKNLSETAEISIALLYRIKFSSKIRISNDFETMINRAINYIQNNFNYQNSCWLDDENTTAKSLNAILFYDEIFNFTFDDFLVDLIYTTNKNDPVFNVNNNIKALDYAQQENSKLLNEKSFRENEIKKLKKDNFYSKKLIKKFKFLVGTLAATATLAILFIICLITIFFTTYPNEWKLIVAKNLALVISTVLGLVITTILTGIAQYLKSKLIEEYEEKEINI